MQLDSHTNISLHTALKEMILHLEQPIKSLRALNINMLKIQDAPDTITQLGTKTTY